MCDIFDKVFLPLLSLVCAYLIIYLGVTMHEIGGCLDKGYPEVRTTLMLESYCVNIEGNVNGKVYKLGE